MKKVICLSIALIMLVFTLAGCQPASPPETAQDPASPSTPPVTAAPTEMRRVGLLVAHMADQWSIESHTLVAEQGPSRGFEITLADSTWEARTEVQHLDTFMAMDLDLLLLWPVHEVASAGAVQNFMDTTGIPVIAVAVLPEVEGLAGFVGWDTWDAGYSIGQKAADYIESDVDGTANVVLLYMHDENVLVRKQAFLQALDDRGVDYNVLFERNFEGVRETAHNIMESVVQANPDFDVVWAAFDGGALGARSALEAANHHARIFSSGGFEQEVYDLFAANDYWYRAGFIVSPHVYGPAILDAAERFFVGEQVGTVHAPCRVATVENFREVWRGDPE